MNGNNTAAFRTSIFLLLLFHETIQAILLNKPTVFYKACLIPLVIALFEIFNQPAWIFGTIKAIGQRFFFDTVLDFAFTAMLRFPLIAVQTAGTRLSVVTMLIADLTIHSAGGKHTCINMFIRHFHQFLPHSFNSDFHSAQ